MHRGQNDSGLHSGRFRPEDIQLYYHGIVRGELLPLGSQRLLGGCLLLDIRLGHNRHRHLGLRTLMTEKPTPHSTPQKPIGVKCLSIGRPESDQAYLSIVDIFGREHCFDITFMQMRLLSADSAIAVNHWVLKVA